LERKLTLSFDADKLLTAARQARANAYAPYSGFAVGAALLDVEGRIHTGANVENASYSLTTCAERTALGSAISQGVRDFVAIAVAGPESGDPCVPCGACRQVLHEFAPDLRVIVGAPEGTRTLELSALLPDSFSASTLARRGPSAP
jgi:cytidine deaminase